MARTASSPLRYLPRHLSFLARPIDTTAQGHLSQRRGEPPSGYVLYRPFTVSIGIDEGFKKRPLVLCCIDPVVRIPRRLMDAISSSQDLHLASPASSRRSTKHVTDASTVLRRIRHRDTERLTARSLAQRFSCLWPAPSCTTALRALEYSRIRILGYWKGGMSIAPR